MKVAPRGGVAGYPQRGYPGLSFPRPIGSVFKLLLLDFLLAFLLVPHIAANHLGIQADSIIAVTGGPKAVTHVTLLA